MKFTAIDFETAQGKRWSICQVGVIEVENGKIKKNFSSLIKPPFNEYSGWNIAVHGIIPNDTINAPIFPEIWNDLKPFIENKLVVAHNSAFDVSCLKQTLDFYNMDIPDFDVDCTYKRTKYSLDKACKCFNIELNNHHDALCDAVACAKIYLKILNDDFFDISKIEPSKRKSNFKEHKIIRNDLLKPDLKHANPKSPFYGKKIVFTGILESMPRIEAATIAKNYGADICNSINKSINIVVVGIRPGPVKLKKIEKFNLDGNEIKIIYENEFMKMIKE